MSGLVELVGSVTFIPNDTFIKWALKKSTEVRRNDDRNQYYQLLTEEGMPKLKQQALTIAEQLGKEGTEKSIQQWLKAGKL